MAAIAPTLVVPQQTNVNNQHGPAHIWSWTPVTEADTFDAVEVPLSLPDRTIHVFGSFGAATVLVTGSLDGTNYFTLTDPQGNAISKTAAAGEAITELVRYIKLTHSGGTAESISAVLLASGPRRG